MPAGTTPNPTYEEVCSGLTGHNEVVLVVFDPKMISYEALLKTFWENHDPTQGMRQGNDVGTQYRSGIYVFDEAQRKAAEASKAAYGQALAARGYGPITTEILDAGPFYFAEDYHQQYLAKNPGGYCGLGGTGRVLPDRHRRRRRVAREPADLERAAGVSGAPPSFKGYSASRTRAALGGQLRHGQRRARLAGLRDRASAA